MEGVNYALLYYTLPFRKFIDFFLAVSDYYQLDDLLTDEEKALRKKVRAISEKEITPIMTKVCSYY